jgi:hypothetical protein
VWENGEHVTAVAYDAPIPGYGTTTTNNLRLWSSKASHGEFDFTKFNSGEYEQSVAETQRAETISAVLYPNDSLDRGKELRLKQQYFWCAASLFDIVRRFKKSKKAWKEFPNAVAIQVCDLSTGSIPFCKILTIHAAKRHTPHTRHPRAPTHSNRSGGSGVGRGLDHRSSHFRLHQPHRPARSTGEVVRPSLPTPPAPPPPDYLRHQPALPAVR